MRRRAPRDQYMSTILKPSMWGGAIELGVLANHFNTEIASIDVETGRIDQFSPATGGSGYRLVCSWTDNIVSTESVWKMHCCVFWYPLRCCHSGSYGGCARRMASKHFSYRESL